MEVRVRVLNTAPPQKGARYVLYWLQANRRVESNHALLAAAHLANHLGLPVLCYEMLTCRYPYASDRLHTFILEGVAETARRMRDAGIGPDFHFDHLLDNLPESSDAFIHRGLNAMKSLRRTIPNG